MKPRALVIELAAFAAILGIVWWVGGTATDAWLARVARLGLQVDADAVAAITRSGRLQLSVGVVVLAAARAIDARRGRDPIAVPWLLPAALGACAIGFVVHCSTVEVRAGVVVLPSSAGFAQGVLVGCIAAAVVLLAPIDLAELARRGQLALALAIGGLFVALAIAGTGPAGSGTRINLGPIQPIEMVKPLAILFLAAFLGRRAAKLRWQRVRVLGLRWPRLELLLPAIAALVMIVAGLYLIGDLGPVLLLALVFLGMFYLVSRATGWAALALAILVVVIAALGTWPQLAGGGTVQTRFLMWRDPWTNALSNGHQLGDSLWALASGGWQGQGLAEGAVPIVPAGKTDLMLATTTEQLGAIGLLAYQVLLASIVFAGLRIAAHARTSERSLIAGGTALLVLVQWLVIQAGTTGHLPLTGIVVPFLSTGRSSMVVFFVLIAIVARIGTEGRPREASSELGELHAGIRGVTVVAVLLVGMAIATGFAAAVMGRTATSARPILVRLGDGTLVERQNPRLVAMTAKIRRGTITDRRGAPLAISVSPTTRSYPLGNALGTLLGVHPSRVLLPAWSLERAFEARLAGPATATFAPLLDLRHADRDRALAEIDAAVATRSVKLTLDAALQAKVAKLLADGRGKRLALAAVVIDVDTGHVLARAQVPDYDPNTPTWQTRVVTADASFLDRFRGAYGEWPDKTGVHGMFQAGSIGKLFTAIAAVRVGVARKSFACTERDEQGPLFTRSGWPKPIHDHSGDRTHGTIPLSTAIGVSCNVYFAQLGIALGRDPMIALRHAGLDVGYAGELDPGGIGSRRLASTAFGQGAMVINTMQAARMVAAIAAGGRYRRCPPTMELDARCTEIALVDDPAALAPITTGMRQVMTTGTGMGLRPPAGLRVYGKTGTADVHGFRGEEPFGIRPAEVAPPHSWFVAFAESSTVPEGAPARGRIAVAVVVPRGGTGASAAGPIAMQILAAAKDAGYLSTR